MTAESELAQIGRIYGAPMEWPGYPLLERGVLYPTGIPPQACLRWLLETFVYCDLSRFPPEARVGLFIVLRELASSITGTWFVEAPPAITVETVTMQDRRAMGKLRKSTRELLETSWRSGSPHVGATRSKIADPLGLLTEAQKVLRDALEILARGGVYQGGQVAAAEQSRRLVKDSSDYGFRELGTVDVGLVASSYQGVFSYHEVLHAALPDALLAATLCLLTKIPRRLLRVCPYQRDTAACRRIFVRVKAQRWCVEHRDIVRQEQLKRAYRRFQEKTKRQKKRQPKKGGRASSPRSRRPRGRGLRL